MRNAELVTVGAKITDLNMSGFGEAKPTAIDGGEKSFSAEIVLAAEGQKSFDFLSAEDPRKIGLAFGADNPREVRIAVTLEELAVESVNGVDSDVDGRGGEFAFGDEMIEPGVDLVGGDTVGEFGVEPREVDDEGGVGMNRSLREIAKGEELNEFLA